ncbi:MAG: type II CRISPR-associated endonuclease Cas1 [Bacteroidales bacterium]|nr:type II CRISPR-associated endonuclease Cas1 [Bacteroidales bacterium]MCM1148316.1 type II CRISPR-associated endonuclease Cas1 [Bacteroidales bacterium]MCM1206992.1 type II CRISPR-associated endonuclease Cas1 [Bacillota bacterium]MCM1511289.1 type II CRISPR-associated endonuclease Cas1 [Clostridium sp.]
MIKKTLYFGNPAYLSLQNGQLVIKLPEIETNETLTDELKARSIVTKPIEDIAYVVLDNKRITITSGAMEALLANNCSVISCDSHSMPVGLMLPLTGNTVQNERFRSQLDASLPLKKQLWQQTIQQKIANQAAVLEDCHPMVETGCMHKWITDVKSGDTYNVEGKAAAYYWKYLFSEYVEHFVRDREGMSPNHLLNYGYAILRAVMARAIVSSGLLPTLGIHHHNRYNAYCLADDIMEPYRPYVDKLVFGIIARNGTDIELTRDIKSQLLAVPTLDVKINGRRSPLMIAASLTTSSLAKCFSGEIRRMYYPVK